MTGFGIIGTGKIADTHAMAISQIINAELIGAYNRTKVKGEIFGRKHHCKVYDTLGDLLADDAIRVVCICTPSGAHMEVAIACMKAGKHCLIEKPLEINMERCDKIVHACRKYGVKASVVFPSRFYETGKKLKQAIEEKRFGSLVMGDANTKWFRTPEYYASGQWRGTWGLDGGGALMNQGIHAVDLLQWYMGGVKSVQACMGNIRHKNIEVEDTIVAALEFVNGALGTIGCSTASYPGSLRRVEIRGTTGTVIIEDNRFVDWRFRDKNKEDEAGSSAHIPAECFLGGVSDPASVSFWGHQRQIEDMIKAIETGSELFIPIEEGRKSVAIVEAVYESAQKGVKILLKNKESMSFS